MKFLMGIDIGTTSLKACVFNEKGNLIDSVTRAYTLITEGESVEFPAEEYFNLFLSAYNELSNKYKIDAFAIDTQGETLIFLDKNGNPLMNAIVWLDNRAEKEAKLIENKFGLKTIYEITGQTEVPAGYPAPKILWLKNNKPELFEKLDKVVLLEDYLLYRLTGEFYCSKSLYSSTLYLDIVKGEYFEEMLSFIGIDKSYLPVLKESGEKVGFYNGATVSVGALDQIAGFIGSGVFEKHKVSEMTGTALAVCSLIDKIPPYNKNNKVSAYYISKDKYCLLMWAPTAGMVLEWVKKTLYDGVSFKTIDEEVDKIPVGSEGLIVSPNMRGQIMPKLDTEMKGGVYGIDLKHTKAHFARSVMESIACLLRQFVDILGSDITEIVSVGGGAKSSVWLKIKSDITNKKITTLKNNETACLGTAIYAGVGANIFSSVEDAISNLVEIKDEFLPNVDREDYEKLYEKYLAFDSLLLSRNSKLN